MDCVISASWYGLAPVARRQAPRSDSVGKYLLEPQGGGFPFHSGMVRARSRTVQGGAPRSPAR